VTGGRAYFYEDARGANVKFSKLSYAGPIVMGVGGEMNQRAFRKL
jgi:hypothetical protein